MIQKSFYEAPEAEQLLVKFEENIMSQFTTQGTEKGNARGGDDETDFIFE